jgi:hypothetical protein
MTAAVRRVSGLTVREAWGQICTALFLGLYCLVAFAVQTVHGSLGRFWLNTAWGIAQGLVLVAALSASLVCLREMHTLQNRIALAGHVRVSVNRLFRNLALFFLMGLIPLLVISHMAIEVPAVAVSPWTLPLFVWVGAPLCMLSAMAWYRPWPWWSKVAVWLMSATHWTVHYALALNWGVGQGAWLVTALLAIGTLGLLWVRHLLLKPGGASWTQPAAFLKWGKFWLHRWLNRPPQLDTNLGWLLIVMGVQVIPRAIEHPDFPSSLVSNNFWTDRVFFLAILMFVTLRTERSHWRWQMVPGSGFRKRLGTDICKCTAQYWALDVVVFLLAFAVLRWFWAPYSLADVIGTWRLLAWPLMVDGAFALSCAVWFRSIHWRSVPDMTALFCLLLLMMLLTSPLLIGARSWLQYALIGAPSSLQDALMVSVAWLMVLRANKNFETSNWSWLSKGRNSGWWVKIKRS